MLGTVTLTRRNEVPIHTYTSPEAGWLVNPHIIELPTQLLVVDAQSTLTFASEVVRYAETLEKTDHSCLYLTLSSGSSSRNRRFLDFLSIDAHGMLGCMNAAAAFHG